jgi:hypothetical protein
MQRTMSEGDATQPLRSIDLATALGVGIEDAAQDGDIATVSLCQSVGQRRAYWRFLDEQGIQARTVHEAHPRATAMMVHLDARPVGAAALLPDSALGLPLPASLQPVIARLRRDGRQMALLDPLVIPSEMPARGAGLVLRSLLRLALLAARRLDGRSDVLVRCESRYARFFAQVLLFSIEAEQPSQPDGTPAQMLLRLDLDLCAAAWMKLYGDSTWSPYSLYVKPTAQAARVCEWMRRQRQAPSLNDVVSCWIHPEDAEPADPGTIRALCRLIPGLSEHLACRQIDGTGPTSRNRCGTGPVPRIRTPLPSGDPENPFID